ncbi:putative methyltransferase, chloroplastic isoform X1 [Iris pallida]|uniref:Methyltransferase, chloroplastic isoform X1 n=1 Tax=Iris pallida TaxID=29817 RepID=A0AAX6F3K2_IRIPA|nr:putative methyltransferase, chloroplastic isoform X1 [Iris pallida]
MWIRWPCWLSNSSFYIDVGRYYGICTEHRRDLIPGDEGWLSLGMKVGNRVFHLRTCILFLDSLQADVVYPKIVLFEAYSNPL